MRRTTLTAATGLGLGILLGTTGIATAQTESPYVTKPCPGDQQYYPDEDPTKFWECSNGTAYRFDCPAGLWWDTKLLTCNWPDAAGRETPPPS